MVDNQGSVTQTPEPAKVVFEWGGLWAQYKDVPEKLATRSSRPTHPRRPLVNLHAVNYAKTVDA